MIVSLATLVVGLLIGYFGQKSTFCTISGIRDFFLLKDTYRLKGLLGIIAGGVIGYTAFKLMGGYVPSFPLGTGYPVGRSPDFRHHRRSGNRVLVSLAEGCPFRQHVMAAEGRDSAMFYLFGFYVGIAYFFMVSIRWLELLLQVLS